MGVLYINNTKIDTAETIVFPITYSIADIKNPNTRQRNKTKTIVLPDTLTNRRFFSSSYQISLSDLDSTGVGFEFDHRLKYPARYESNGVSIFKGVCNLLCAKINNGVLSIEINLFSDIVNMFDVWGDLRINQLGWSEYDHTLNKATVEASWGNLNSTGYVYGLIYFGYNINQLAYKTNDLVPYVFQIEILKKALDFVGLKLSSATLNSADFKRRVWGYGGGDKISITAAEANNRYVYVDSDLKNTDASFNPVSISQGAILTTTVFNSTIQPDIGLNTINLVSINNNLLNQVDLSNGNWIGSWTVANKGVYRVSFNGDIALTAGWSWGDPFNYGYPASMNFYWEFSIYINGLKVKKQIIESLSNISNVSFTSTINVFVDSLLSSGDVVGFGLKMQVVNSSISTHNLQLSDLVASTLDMHFHPITILDFKMESIDKELQDGETVNIARWMPETKVSDFFSDLIITENLYISEPKDGHILMESFNNYYSNDSDDWTDKIDLSKEIVFEPPKMQGKDYIWKFAQDRDYFKAIYFNEYGLDYGDYKVTISGSYKKGEKIWQTKFAQSIPVDVAPNNSGELIIPVIVKSEDNGVSFQPYKGKPRVFYYNGLQGCYPWTFSNSINGSPTSELEYPQFHHLNNVVAPTFDYNFGKPDKVYYTATNYTIKNIIQENYFTFIRSILSKSAKIMKAYFNLNESDFYDNFLRTYTTVDCVRFIKNLVVDYNDNSLDTTMVELFKIVDAKTPNNSVISLPSGAVDPAPPIGFITGLGVSYNTGSAQSIASNSIIVLTNNESTKEDSYFPNGVSSIYNKETSDFDFSEMDVGSIVNLIVFATTEAFSETTLNVNFLIADGTEFEKEIPFVLSNNKINASKEITMSATIIIDEVIKNNTSKIMISNTTACTIKANSYQYVIKSIRTWKK